jgi:membrane protease YdiL (CAAX protease family)
VGAVVSGLLFGIAHGDPFEVMPLAFGGMVLCGVYYITRNAYASMISHALFNSISIFALLFAPQLTQ